MENPPAVINDGALYEMGKLTFDAAYESKQDFKSFQFNGYGCPAGYQEASMDGGVNYRCWAADGSGGDAPKEYLTGDVAMDQPPVMTIGVGYTDNQLKVAADISIIQWSETLGKNSPESTYANYVWNMNWSDHDRAFETLMYPGVVETHYTLGASFKTSKKNMVNIGYMMVPKKSVSGDNALQGITGYETSLSENSLEVAVTSYF